MGVANKKPTHISTPTLVNNAHPITCIPYAKFQPDWSINEFLAGIMTHLILIELVVFIYLYVHDNLPNGYKDPVENWQM